MKITKTDRRRLRAPQSVWVEGRAAMTEDLAYHVTPATNWPSIASQGLLARVGPRSESMKEQPAVFLFPDLDSCHVALSSWLGDEFEEVPEDGLLILEVDISGLPYQQSVEFEKEVVTDIPVDRVRRVVGEDWNQVPDKVLEMLHQGAEVTSREPAPTPA